MADPRQQTRPRGEILKEAREAQGLALLTVHESTKIPMDVLKAIEEGYTVRTLSPFYLKGFVKMYAQYLGVDVNQVLEPAPPKDTPAEKVKDEKPLTSSSVPLVRLDFQKFLTKDNQQLLLKGLAVMVGIFLVLRISGCVRDAWQKRTAAAQNAGSTAVPYAADKKEQPAAEKKDEGKKDAASPPASSQKKEAQPKEEKAASPASQAKEVRLTVKAKKSGWLQVKVDGSLVFQSILNSGATETWQAEQSIELSGKNIHSLEYEVNGKVLGELGRADRSARRVVITKDGFSVKQ